VAEPGDRIAVAHLVAAAFADDPAWAFLFGSEYDRLAPLFAAALFDTRVAAQHVWVTRDLDAVAMWEHMGADPISSPDHERRWTAYRAEAGDPAWQRLVEYDRAIDEARPRTPHWYLGVLATRPDRRGRGLATAVMGPVLARADREGVDCCLETSTHANVLFYERRGFTESTDVLIASGPPTWWLRRAPRGA
jgi:GNAT superfamily N-acetyltransferase